MRVNRTGNDGRDSIRYRTLERADRRTASFDFMMETTRDFCGPLSQKLRAVAKSQPQNLSAIVAAAAAPPKP